MLRTVIAEVMLLVAPTLALAQAQPTTAPATQPAVSVNQPLADAVARARDAKSFDQAIAKAKELDGSQVKDVVWANNASTVASLLLASGKPSDALVELKARTASVAADTAGLDVATSDARARSLLLVGRRLLAQTRDTTLRLDIARLNLSLSSGVSGEFSTYFAALQAAGKNDEALQACVDYASDKGDPQLSTAKMRNRRLLLMVKVNKDAATISAEAKELLKVTDDPTAALAALRYVLPAGDVSLCAGLTAQQLLDNYKVMLRKQTGQLNTAALLALSNQLTKGGEARPMTVSDEAKALADQQKDAPLSAFLTPLLTGDHAAAFKFAYAKARDTTDDAAYIAWINAASGCLRCLEQCYNGKALDFIQYVNGKATTNPAADLVNQ